MRAKASLKIVLALALSAGLALGIYFGATHYFANTKKSPGTKSYKTLKRKLAYTSDPRQLLEKARESEGRADWEGALAWYNILVNNLRDDDPRKGLVYHRRAFCYYQLEDYPRARVSMEYGLNHFRDLPQVDSALFLMAQIYSKLGDFELADKTYNTIIKMFPHRAEEAKNLQSQLPQNLKKP